MASHERRFYEFGRFRVDAAERVLLRDGRPVALTPKLFDTLLALVERSGHLVEKSELMETVWPGTFVEESNLSSNVSLLRKALGAGEGGRPFIETVARRGYRFADCVRVVEPEPDEELIVRRRTRARLVTREEEDDEAYEGGPPLFGGGRGAALPAVAAPLRSLAVLPFAHLGAGEDYLGLGLADALITQLSNTGQIVVRPTSAVRRYADPDRDAAAVGRELGVDAVVEGSVQQAGGRLRVTVQMVSARDGVPLWADKFVAPFTDILDVQDSISEQAARALTLRLTGHDRRLLRKRYTEDADAYRAYLRGRYFWNKRSVEGFRRAIEHYREAVERDPAYALAYAGISDALTLLAVWGEEPPRETLSRAREMAERALEIDEELPEAHTSLGYLLSFFVWDFARAEAEYRRAIELNPNSALAHNRYAQLLVTLERFDEATAEMQKALALDPLSPMVNTAVGGPFLYSRRYDEAVEQYRRALELEPDFVPALFPLSLALAQLGDFEEAVAVARRAAEASGEHPIMLASLAGIYASAGRREEAAGLLERLLTGGRAAPPYVLAGVYARLGDPDRAFACLERAFAERASHLADLNIDPEFDPIRADPRFRELARRVGLPEK
jgi:DNA-binding winged helix-turn-helix (wHTH) protein/TolB-like protein/Tfp pilus assembly protein PilF